MKRNLKILSLAIVIAFMFTLAVGCGSGAATGQTGTTTAGTAENTTAAPQETQKELIELTAFGTSNSEIDALTGGDPNNSPVAKEWEKRTGVRLKWILATPEDFQQKLQLLMSSKNVPDIFSDGSFPQHYPGGPSKAAEDGIIVKLNPYLDTLCPDYKAAFSKDPTFEKMVKADNGDIYGFSVFRTNLSTVFFGPMIRKDILDKAGVALPETMDEWHTALKALKDAGFSTPLSMVNWFVSYCGGFTGAYGVCQGYYVGPDSTVHYGAMEDGYKQYLETFNQWVKEGLLDPDLFTLSDQNLLDTKLVNGKAGAALNWVSRLGSLNENGRKTDPNYNMVATKYPVLNKGDQPLFAQRDNPVVIQDFVGGTGSHKEDAIKWYNYTYTPDGFMFANFGVEGVSYTMKDGVPTYTDEIFKNPQGWSITQAENMYLPVMNMITGMAEHEEYFKQLMLTSPEQRDGVAKWGESKLSSLLPPLSYTQDEMTVMKKQADIDTYVNEMSARFILGEEPLTKWDEYVKHINDMGIADLLKVYNDANERFKAR